MKMIQLNRLWLLGLLTLLWIAVPQVMFAQVDTPIVTPVVTPEPSSDRIDLTIDKEADGMPDELQAALDQLNAVYDAYLQEDGTLRDDPEAQAALREAETKFRDRLPYAYHNAEMLGFNHDPFRAVSRLNLLTDQAELWPLPDGWNARDIEVVNDEILLAYSIFHEPATAGLYRFDPVTSELALLVNIPGAHRILLPVE